MLLLLCIAVRGLGGVQSASHGAESHVLVALLEGRMQAEERGREPCRRDVLVPKKVAASV